MTSPYLRIPPLGSLIVTVKIARPAFVLFTLVQVLIVLAAIERPAYGYVDPGSGILVVQFVGSACSAGLFFLRKRIRQLFFPVKAEKVGQSGPEIEP
jgi:hypothetical protein